MHSNVPRSLLLGTAGLQRRAWSSDYYPADLPADWCLDYYANDCDCVLLEPGDWQTGSLDALGEALDQAADGFHCFLQLAPGVVASAVGGFAALDPDRVALLTTVVDPGFDHLPQWLAGGGGCWQDADSHASLVQWQVDVFDLRELRQRAQTLAADARALVIAGDAGSPGYIGQLRTLLELLGRA